MSNSNSNWISATIIDDDSDNDNNNKLEVIISKPKRKIKSGPKVELVEIETEMQSIKLKDESEPKEKIIKMRSSLNNANALKHYFNPNMDIIEMGIDEAGRGPMFGRVYAGVVVLPKDNEQFKFDWMKDSKKFHSKKKIEQVADYIKENCVAWAVEFEDEQKIDEINILQATQSAMHKAIKNVLIKLYANTNTNLSIENILLLVDGNYFKTYSTLNKSKTKLEIVKHLLVEGGDNKFCSIAAASILAKVERDKYIEELCLENPELVEYYGIDSNKGYGSKKHLDGIKEHGITKWHRKTFGICKEYA
jgi:ribonuclease HII